MNFGVIGYGHRISSFINANLRSIEPDTRITGIVDPDRNGVLSRLAECDKNDVVFYKNIDEMVRKTNLDALIIGTRCNLHAEYAIQASKYDIPLYLEKPVAITMEQALALEKAFEHSKCEVIVSFPLRLSPLCKFVKDLINKGAVGSCEHITALNYVPYGFVYWEQEYRNYSITQGLFVQKATHDFDYMSYLMGAKITRIAAMATKGRVFGGEKPSWLMCSQCEEKNKCLESPENRKRNQSTIASFLRDDHPCLFSIDCGTPETGMNEDSSSALLEFDSGAHGIYTQVFFSRRNAAARGAIISGYDGTVSFDWYTNEIKHVHHHVPFTNTIKADQNSQHFGGDTVFCEDFVDMIRGKKKSTATIWDGIQSIYTCLAANDSIKTGKLTNVRQVGSYSSNTQGK